MQTENKGSFLYQNGEIGFNLNGFQIYLKDKGLYINNSLFVCFIVQIHKDGEYLASSTWTKEDFTMKKAEDYISEKLKELEEQ